MIKFAKYVAYLLTTASLSACLKTPLPNYTIDQGIYRLQAHNPREVVLHVAELPEQTLGRQYLLLALPFGRIVDQEFAKRLYDISFQELALRGCRPIATQSIARDKRILNITPQKLSLNAFDFIFFRRIVAHVELQIALDNRNVEWVSAEETSYAQTAFGPELSALFDKAITNAVNKGFETLGL